MFGTQLFDVAIGLVFTYTILSLLSSALVEVLEAGLRTRAKYLWQGLGELLQDDSARTTGPQQKRDTAEGHDKERTPAISLAAFYCHPLIGGLYYGDYDQAKGALLNRSLPAYIPRSNFAVAVIDMVSSSHRSTQISTMESLRRGVQGMSHVPLGRALDAILAVSGNDLTAVQRSLEDWYDSAMDRVSGWYKRHAQVMLLASGFGVAMALNADTFALVRHLTTDEPAREALVEAAASFVAASQGEPLPSRLGDIQKYVEQIQVKGSPLGQHPVWSGGAVFGFLVTAFAISLGAPFWFDLLNKLSVIRATVKPKEKSGDEGSEDRGAAGSLGGSSRPTSFVMRE